MQSCKIPSFFLANRIEYSADDFNSLMNSFSRFIAIYFCSVLSSLLDNEYRDLNVDFFSDSSSIL